MHPGEVARSKAEFPGKSLFSTAASLRARLEGLRGYFAAIAASEALAHSTTLRLGLGHTEGTTLYATLTVCPGCMLVEGAGAVWVQGRVLEAGGRVILRPQCAEHAAEIRRAI